MKRPLALGAAMVAWLLPALAAACPQCAGREKGGFLETIALAAFLLLPFAAAGIVIRVVRAHGDDGADGPTGRAPAGPHLAESPFGRPGGTRSQAE